VGRGEFREDLLYRLNLRVDVFPILGSHGDVLRVRRGALGQAARARIDTGNRAVDRRRIVELHVRTHPGGEPRRV